MSAQIRTLEDDLGVPLFHRQGTGVVLTPAGETYLAYAGKLLALQEEAVQRAREDRQPAATLSLRMPQSLAEAYLPQRPSSPTTRAWVSASRCAASRSWRQSYARD